MTHAQTHERYHPPVLGIHGRDRPPWLLHELTLKTICILFNLFFALMVIPGPPLFSLTIQLHNPFPCPVTSVTGQRLLKQSFPDSASRLCTVGSATICLIIMPFRVQLDRNVECIELLLNCTRNLLCAIVSQGAHLALGPDWTCFAVPTIFYIGVVACCSCLW